MSRPVDSRPETRNASFYLDSFLTEPSSAPPASRASRNRHQHPQSRNAATASTRENQNISRARAISMGPATERVYCAIAEGRGVATVVGMCFIIPATCELVMSNIVDSQTYIRTLQKLDVFDPDEILLPISSIIPTKSKLCLLIEEHFPGAKIVETPRRQFSQEIERELVLKYACKTKREALNYELNDKYFMVSAASALVQHVKSVYSASFDMNQLRIKIQASEDSMVLSTQTVSSLEVINNLLDKSAGMSLFKLMNHTKTSMGKRVLRSNLLQPLIKEDVLTQRQDAVEELCKNVKLTKECQDKLGDFEDLDKLLTSMSYTLKKKPSGITDRRINQIIMLKDAVTASLAISDILRDAQSSLLVDIRERLGSQVVHDALNIILRRIDDSTTWAKTAQELRRQRSHAVRSGINGFLDVSRNLYREYSDDINGLIDGYSNQYAVPFERGYDVKRGHFLKVPFVTGKNLNEMLPSNVFIHQHKTRKYLECTTLEIMKCNTRIKNVLSEIIMLSDQIIDDLFINLKTKIFELFMVSESVSVLDLLCAFAHLASSSTGGYVRPEFTSSSGNKLAIKLSRHPILDRTMKYRLFIPNDIYSTPDTSRMNIITGVNMSGKSVYLRQVALIIIMAQTGCL